jgi:hypothetical protein
MMRSALVLCVGILALAGCSNGGSGNGSKVSSTEPKQPVANMGIVNTKCPIVPSHGAKAKTVVDFNGQKVGLCCAGCLPDWNKMNDEQKAAALKAAM